VTGLFDLPLLPGLQLADDVITPAEEQVLIACIDAAKLTPFQFGNYQGKRLTRSFGAHYDFGRQRLQETEAVPKWLLPLRQRAAAFAGLQPDDLGHVLLIRYDPGTGIGWHKDRPAFDQVIGVSLGAAADLAFRRRRADGRFDRCRVPLPARSAYLLTGPARWEWEHGIAAHASLRYSVTFRSFAAVTNGSAIGKVGMQS